MDKKVTVIGGINIDIKGKSFGSLIRKSSNPGTIQMTAGGVGRNIAHNLSLLGVPVTLLGAVGSDMQGQRVLSETSECGVDTSHVLRHESLGTGTYLALLDNTGEMDIALSGMEIYSQVDIGYLRSKLELLRDSSYIICDTNIPLESIEWLIHTANSLSIPICVEPVSVSKALIIREKLSGIDLITPNGDELRALAGAEPEDNDMEKSAQLLIQKGVKNVITTLGERGLCHTDSKGSRYIHSYKSSVADVTGAGDSLTAGLIYGYLEHGSVEQACSYGLAAAAITIASPDTVSRHMNVENIESILRHGHWSKS